MAEIPGGGGKEAVPSWQTSGGTMWSRIAGWMAGKPLSDEEFAKQRAQLLERTPVPVFWLFGKTGSGKSTIVRYLTGATAAEIGTGFRPQTQHSSEFDFPDAQQPIAKFLDTRGLGEAHYDPQEDLTRFAAASHVMIVTVRAVDQALEPILAPLREIRRQQPSRPVLLAVTCLHEAYPGQQHPTPDPFTAGTHWPASLPVDLRRCLGAHQQRFAGLVDRIVPIDITPQEEGFHDPTFGGSRLEQELQDLLPRAYRQTLVALHEVREQLQDLTERKAWSTIVNYSSLAATAAASPLPWADIPAVLGVQSRMIYLLADMYGQKMQADLVWKMAAALGGQIAARFAIRAPLKLIPVIGMTANAALAFAYTLSLGKACCWYFGEMRDGHIPTEEELKAVWGQKLNDALTGWRRGGASRSGSDHA